MKKITLLLTLFLSFIFADTLRAQTVDEVIDKYYEAVGGKNKWENIKSMKLTGKMVLGQGMEATFQSSVTNAPFNGMYNEFTLMGMTGKQSVTDKNAWQLMPFQGNKNPEPMPEDDAKQMRIAFDIQGPLFNYAKKGHKVELVGKEDMDGSEVYKIKCELADNGGTIYYFIDAGNYMLLKEEKVFKHKDKEVKDVTEYSNFVKTEYGVTIPMTNTVGSQGGQMIMEFEKVEINQEVDPKIFVMPEKKK